MAQINPRRKEDEEVAPEDQFCSSSPSPATITMADLEEESREQDYYEHPSPHRRHPPSDEGYFTDDEEGEEDCTSRASSREEPHGLSGGLQTKSLKMISTPTPRDQESTDPEQTSPTASAVSVSSIPCTFVSAFLSQKARASDSTDATAAAQLPFQLTPVICNTSSFGNHHTAPTLVTTGSARRGPITAVSTTEDITKGWPSVVSPIEGIHRHIPRQEGTSPLHGIHRTTQPFMMTVDCSGKDQEHLSLPNDLADDGYDGQDDEGNYSNQGRRRHQHPHRGVISISGVAFPPLRIAATHENRLPSLTVRSSNSNDTHVTLPHPPQQPLGVSLSTRASSAGPFVLGVPPPHAAVHSRSQDFSSEKMPLHNPIAFPTRKKFNSFSSRQQYENSSHNRLNPRQVDGELRDLSEGHYSYAYGTRSGEDEEDFEGNILGLAPNGSGSRPLHHQPQQYGLTPYQPPRPDDAVLEVPPEEELSQIFAARARFFENRTASEGSSGEKNHRLSVPSPLHLSGIASNGLGGPSTLGSEPIPSLHLARRLSTATLTDNASVTTHTTLNTWGEGEEDEDDFLLNTSSNYSNLSIPSWSRSSWQQHVDNSGTNNYGHNNDPNYSEPFLLEDPEADAGFSPHRRVHPRSPSNEDSPPSVVVEGFDGGDELLPWQQTPRRGSDSISHRFRIPTSVHRTKGGDDDENDDDVEGAEADELQYPTGGTSSSGQFSIDNDTTMAVDARYIKEQEALDWIQSLQESSQDATTSNCLISEAASSRFLCGGAGATTPVHSPTRKRAAPSLLHSSRSGAQPFHS